MLFISGGEARRLTSTLYVGTVAYVAKHMIGRVYCCLPGAGKPVVSYLYLTIAERCYNTSSKLDHSDYSKVFSTILLTAFNYLTANPNHYLGVDGSSNSRATLYWRFLQNNYNYLDQFFDMFGLKYYVRISRFGKTQYDNPFDFDDIYPHLDTIQKTTFWPKLMYNYFIFKLKPGLTILE
jgi:hypothetical protein